MLDEAATAGLGTEDHVDELMTDGTLAQIHPSRTGLFRVRLALERPLDPDGFDTRLHPSVQTRYENDDDYRPPNLVRLLQRDDYNWNTLVGT